ncbi:MAG: hypothetical protein P4L83_02620 [Nevskia sp.]|nr:hypothetical protein [Nevskia sp.]
MELRALSNLLLRLAGLLILVHTVLAVPGRIVDLYVVTASTPHPQLEIWTVSVLSAVFPAIAGLALLYFPSAITNAVVGKSEQPPSFSVDQLQGLAFSTLGLYFVSKAAYDAVYWYAKLRLYDLAVKHLSYADAPAMLPREFAGMVSTGAQFFIGMFLLLGGGSLAALIVKLRRYGRMGSGGAAG